MTTTLLTFAVVALATIFYCQATTFTTCDFPYEKVGCFKDKPKPNRALPEELVNDRDPTNPAWSGHMITWKQYGRSVHSLACRCAAAAKAKGYKVFGLQFYGECWSGPGGEHTYAKYGVANSDMCVQGIYHPSDVECDKSKQQECIGGILTNYVYRLKEEFPSVPVDGGYTEWSEWTSCSKTCGGGQRTRERTCTNPKPEGKGKDCSGLGPAAETEACGEQECPVPCKKALDIGIILDGSSSVGELHFKVAIFFLKHLLKYFEISPQATHVGFILYSTNATLEFKMSDSRYYSRDKLEARLHDIAIEYPKGATYTDKALEMASNELFTPAGGDRPDKPNVLIVLTDGNTNINSKPYNVVLAPLKRKNVRIIAVGIGNEINGSELLTIALGDPKYVVHVIDFYSLKDNLTAILNSSCED